MRVAVIGAGVAGLVTAFELAERGVDVELFERAVGLGQQACSWAAGGMLAPWCERESAEAAVVTLGQQALDWWPRHYLGTRVHGTLVLAPARDAGELTRFSARTDGFERLDADGVAALEPDLAGRFRQGLYFAQEAHLDPRLAMAALAEALQAAGVPIHYGVEADETGLDADRIVDCRGLSARDCLGTLRGVRGEMLVLRTNEISLSRPVRLLHPRVPLYVVPRSDGHFMIGATMIESDDRSRVSARSAIELLSAAYALHPAFGEAEVIELRADVRPAFPDNLPRIVEDGRVLRFNGLFRHGFLLSPALARQVADRLLAPQELSHADHRQRRHA
jgi:glycine oxidase